jgi:hypothetical protein
MDNIRTRSFWDYVTEESRRKEIAVLGTAYRFARWFATLEMLYDRAEFLALSTRAPATQTAIRSWER